VGRASRHYEHVVRVGALFALGIAAFLVIRHFLVPADFGVYGFYRAGALDDARAHPVHYAGRETCAVCHVPVIESQKNSKHAPIGCESCHGPLAKHAAGEFDPKPKASDPRLLCLSCHTKMEGKYDRFPQIDPADHGGDVACATCHQPHQPRIGR
jgi:Cytochrome c7 and related cytochrome c